MSDDKKAPPSTPVSKGYVPYAPKMQGGYQGPSGKDPSPPSGGSAVQPPPAKPK
jgi:hypothetical protein